MRTKLHVVNTNQHYYQVTPPVSPLLPQHGRWRVFLSIDHRHFHFYSWVIFSHFATIERMLFLNSLTKCQSKFIVNWNLFIIYFHMCVFKDVKIYLWVFPNPFSYLNLYIWTYACFYLCYFLKPVGIFLGMGVILTLPEHFSSGTGTLYTTHKKLCLFGFPIKIWDELKIHKEARITILQAIQY